MPLYKSFLCCPEFLQDYGGVGLFYKNYLPLKLRNDLAFCESRELKFRGKKIFGK